MTQEKFRLLEKSLEMISLAKSKGYDADEYLLRPVMLELWQEFVFCNSACAVIAWWLRDKHSQFVSIFFNPVHQFWEAVVYQLEDDTAQPNHKVVNKVHYECSGHSYEGIYLQTLIMAIELL